VLSLGSALSPFRRDTRTINAAHPVNLKCWQTLPARCLVSEPRGGVVTSPRSPVHRTCTSGGHSGSNTMFIVFHSPARSSSRASRGIHGLNSYPIVRPGQGRYW
jgi:hypothetical protein